MEIGAASPSTYQPPQIADTRSARNALREISGTQANTVPVRQEERSGQAANVENLNSRRTEQANQSRVAANKQSERESRAESKEETSQGTQPVAAGHIKLDVEDGNRVLQVFDSKDVLIYQMPPKGTLMLIKAQENEQQSQVQTSA